LKGDPKAEASSYGPENVGIPTDDSKTEQKKAAPAAEEDDDIDLFGSDDEEEDAEAEKLKAQRLEEYR